MEPGPRDSAISVGLGSDSATTSKAYQPSTPTTAQQPLDLGTPPELTEEQQLAQDQEIFDSFAQASTAITVDSPPPNDDFEGDDGYESDITGSVTTSISSSVRDFQFENGRRYHRFREGSYYFPNDASEQDREDLKHATMGRLLQKLYFAPIGDNPQQILDLGTGTGIWAIEMGDLFPGATVRGVDLSPIQPEWVPPNVKFIVDDFESQWLYDNNFFDYIHTRHTVMAVRDWDRLYSQAFRHLKPGGWIESQEIVHLPHCSDNTMPPNWPIAEYWNLITSALAKSNVNFSSAPLLAQKMVNAGFTNVTEQVLHVPLGPWARNRWLKLVGVYWRTVLFDGASAIALRPLTREHGWTMQEVEVWLTDVRKAYMDESVHSWMPLYLVQGQKPLDGMPASNWNNNVNPPNQTFHIPPPLVPQPPVPTTQTTAVPQQAGPFQHFPEQQQPQPQFEPQSHVQTQPHQQSNLQTQHAGIIENTSSSIFNPTTQTSQTQTQNPIPTPDLQQTTSLLTEAAPTQNQDQNQNQTSPQHDATSNPRKHQRQGSFDG